jgi:hypothetical protein
MLSIIRLLSAAKFMRQFAPAPWNSDSKTSSRLIVLAACLAGMVAWFPQPAFTQAVPNGSGVQVGHVPRAVQEGTARAVGPYDRKQMLRLAFGLQPPHMAEEEQFLQDLRTPGSPQFMHFLTADQWNARFAPSVEDEQAVADWAKQQGLTITQRYANRLLVDAEAPVAIISTRRAQRTNNAQP